MTGKSSVPFRGHLDHVGVAGAELRVQGWAAATGGAAITDIEVQLGVTKCDTIEVSTQLPSPDVAGVYPGMPGSERCRFSVRARIPMGTKLTDTLLALLLKFGSHPGWSLFNAINPSLPAPSETAVSAVGGGRHDAIAFEFLQHFVNLAGLRPVERVLDVGCGTGRIAYGLAYYLRAPGTYDGFDVMPDLVGWAQREIGSRLPHMRFGHVPVINLHYNRSGSVSPCDFTFPYADQSFDFAFLTSVFTHMRAAELRHYLGELRRVIATGGRCLSTFFLLNDESRRYIASGASSQDFVHPLIECVTAYPDDPEYAIAYDEEQLLGWIAEAGFSASGTWPGTWCGRAEGLSYQDIIVLQAKN